MKNPTLPIGGNLTEQHKRFKAEIYKHDTVLKGFALRLCNDRDTAKDLVQMTYVSAWRFFSSFEPGTNAKSWIFKILHNVFINEFRKNKNNPVTYDIDGVYNVFEKTKSLGLDDEVLTALSNLKDSDRLVCMLCFVEGFTYEEASKMLDIPTGTVRSRLNRTRLVLKDSLALYAGENGY